LDPERPRLLVFFVVFSEEAGCLGYVEEELIGFGFGDAINCEEHAAGAHFECCRYCGERHPCATALDEANVFGVVEVAFMVTGVGGVVGITGDGCFGVEGRGIVIGKGGNAFAGRLWIICRMSS
jgi:hypothetical protein